MRTNFLRRVIVPVLALTLLSGVGVSTSAQTLTATRVVISGNTIFYINTYTFSDGRLPVIIIDVGYLLTPDPLGTQR